MIELTAWSQNPAKAARIANALAELYLEDQSRAKTAIAEPRQQVAERAGRRAAPARHRLGTGLRGLPVKFGLYDTGGESLSNRQMGQLNDQLATARARLAEARGRYEELKKITPATLRTAAALPDVLQSSVVANLRGQYAELARRRAELVTRYGPKHPQVPVVQAQVDDMTGTNLAGDQPHRHQRPPRLRSGIEPGAIAAKDARRPEEQRCGAQPGRGAAA